MFFYCKEGDNTATISLQIKPNPRQEEFFMATARHIGYGGARGGGKSWAMRTKFVLLASQYKDLRILLLRRTLPELRENHILPLMQILNKFAPYKETDKAFIFPNGSRIKLGYCDAETDVLQYQGQEYDVIGMEEATHFTEFQMVLLSTCNRTGRSDFKPRMYYTANPGNVGHAWFKRLFIDRDYRNNEKPENYIFIPARVYDNEILMKNNPEYVDLLKNLPEDLRRAHLDGDWNVFAGQFFREFRIEKHVIDPFEIPSNYKRFVSIDWGYRDHCAVLWHAVDNNHVYTYRELHIRETIASEVAKKIKQLQGDEDISYNVASPDMWQKRGSGTIHGANIAESFRSNGVPLVSADNARIVGWERIREYMADSPDGTPYWQVFRTCANLIKCLPQLTYDDYKVEDAATEPHEITDAPDSLRYALMSRPRPNSSVVSNNFIYGGSYLRKELALKGFKDWEINRMVREGQIKLIGK